MQFNNTRTEPEVLSYQAIRKTIGWLGICLPFALVIVNAILNSERIWQESISHYYYTIATGLFVGSLCAVGLFLISYRGFGPADNRASTIAGIAAFGVALFPTTVPAPESKWNIYAYAYSDTISTIHFVSAAIFFLTLAFTSYFLFTQSKDPAKAGQNRLYRICGVAMVLFIALIAAYNFVPGMKERFEQYNPTFWLECCALFAFGTSWLVKGQALYKPKAA
jgi:putative copper export protein